MANENEQGQASAPYGSDAAGGALASTGALEIEEVIDLDDAVGNADRRMVLNMGPQHPSTHGVLRLIVTLNGETVDDVVPDIGYLHRNWEKIVESWQWPQIIALSDRNDYLGPILNEIAYCTAAERIFDIELTERAKYLRVITGELSRIASHLISIGTYGLDLGAVSAFLYCFRHRERIYDIYEHISGARMLPGWLRIGGVRNDVPDEFGDMVRTFVRDMQNDLLPEIDTLFLQNGIFKARTKGIGVLSKEDAIRYGASGPVLRASGVPFDLRVTENYLPYDRFDWEVVSLDDGDCYSRAMVRFLEMQESLKIISQAMDQMEEGPVMAKTPRQLRADEGETFVRVEGAKGQIGVYVVSKGGFSPYRIHWRAPSFVHLQLVPLLAKGHLIADLVAIVGSLDPVFGEVDR